MPTELSRAIDEISRLQSENKELKEVSTRYLEITLNVKRYSDEMYEDAKYQLEQALKDSEI